MGEMTLAILVLIGTLALHLIEEIKTGFRERLPLGEMPLPLFVGINIAVYTFCFVTLAMSATGHPLARSFAWVFAGAMVANGLLHIGIMVLRREYYPGGVTALLLLGVAGYLIALLVRGR